MKQETASPAQIFNAPTKTLTFDGAYGKGETSGAYSPGVTLNGAIDAVVTAIVVSSGVNIINGQCIAIDTEEMLVTAGGGTASLTVARGANSTVAATHADTAAVTRSASTAGPLIWTISPGGIVALLYTSFQATTSLVLGGGSITIGSASSTGGIVGLATAATAPQYLLSSGAQGALAGILKLIDASNGTFPLLINESIQPFHATADTTGGVLLCNALYVPITPGATLT